MPSVEFRYYLGGQVSEVAMTAVDMRKVDDNVIRLHRLLGHQGAYDTAYR